MELAVARFRTRMAAANRTFLAARIAEQRREPTTETSKIDAMSRFWFPLHRERWQVFSPSKYMAEHASAELKEQWRLEAAVKTLDDIATLPHYHMDGTEPPPSETFRRKFITTFQEVVNGYANVELLNSDEHIRIPDELEQLLVQTAGIYDVDFRKSGISNFSPLRFLKEDHSDVQMYNIMTDWADPEKWERAGVLGLRYEFDVADGLIVDEAGEWPEKVPDPEGFKWFTMFAYCRAANFEYDEEYEDWEWQILCHCKTGFVDYDMYSFKTIGEFLDWYSSWDHRLDETAMREATMVPAPEMR